MSSPILDLVPYVIAALGLAACIALFVVLKAEMYQQAKKADRARRELTDQCAVLQSSLEEMRRQIAELPPANRNQPPAMPRLSLQMTHRAQALRLSRRGENPGQIAAALGVPVAEVELLLKVHQATAGTRA